MSLPRNGLRGIIAQRLEDYRVVAIIGAHQVGKTTLAGQVAEAWPGEIHRFDLEDPVDIGRLSDPGLALRPLKGLIVLDEIQRLPDVFPLLRVLADRPRSGARFLLLGSASPDLLYQSSETLAGRITYLEVQGFGLEEVGADKLDRLWPSRQLSPFFSGLVQRSGNEVAARLRPHFLGA